MSLWNSGIPIPFVRPLMCSADDDAKPDLAGDEQRLS